MLPRSFAPWLAVLRAFGIEGAMEERWGGRVPRDLVLVTPASLAEVPRLERVAVTKR